MNYFNKIVGGMTAPNNSQDQLKSELQKLQKKHALVLQKAKKLLEQKEFVSKSYEELEKKYEILNSTTESDNVYLKKNIQTFVNMLQAVPDDIINNLVQGLIQKISENIGQQISQQDIKSVLDLDFNYKNVFATYIGKIYEVTKEKIKSESTVKEENETLQMKLQLKEKQIEEIVDRYQSNMKGMEKQFGVKLSNKIQEFGMVKEQKDILIKDLTESISLKVQENQEVKANLIKMKNSENTLKITKEKMEAKLSEQFQINNELLSRSTQFNIQLKTIREDNQNLLTKLREQKNTIMLELTSERQKLKQLQAIHQISVDSIYQNQIRRAQMKSKLQKIDVQAIKGEIQEIRKTITSFVDKTRQNLKENNEFAGMTQLLEQYKNTVIQQLSNSTKIDFQEMATECQKHIFIQQRDQTEKSSQQGASTKENQQEIKQEARIREQINNTAIVKELQEKVAQLNFKLIQKQEKLSKLMEQLINKNQKIQDTQSQIQQASIQMTSMQKEYETLKQSFKKNIQVIDELQLNSEKLKSNQEDLISQLNQMETLKSQIQNKQNELNQLKKHSQQIQGSLLQKHQQFDQSQQELITIQKQFTDHEQKMAILEKQIQQYKILMKENEANLLMKLQDQINSHLEVQNNLMEKDNMINEKDALIKNKSQQLRRLLEEHQLTLKELNLLQIESTNLNNELFKIANENNKTIQQLNLLKERILQQQQLKHQISEQLKNLKSIQLAYKENINEQSFIIQQRDNKIISLESELKLSQDKNIEAEKQTSKKQQAIEQLLRKYQQQSNLLIQTKSKLDQVETTAQQAKRQWNSKIKHLERQLEEKDRNLTSKQNDLQRLQQRLNILNENLNSKEGQTNNSLQLINELEDKYKQQISNNQSQIILLERKINQLENGHQQLKEVIETMQKNNTKKNEQINNLDRQLKKASDSIQALQKEKQQKIAEIDEYAKREDQLKQDLLNLEQEMCNDNQRIEYQQKIIEQHKVSIMKLTQQKHNLEITTQKLKDDLINITNMVTLRTTEIEVLQAKLSSQLEQKTTNAFQYEETLQKLNDSIAQKEQIQSDLQKELSFTKQQLEIVTKQKLILEQNYQRLSKNLEQVQIQKSKISEQFSQFIFRADEQVKSNEESHQNVVKQLKQQFQNQLTKMKELMTLQIKQKQSLQEEIKLLIQKHEGSLSSFTQVWQNQKRSLKQEIQSITKEKNQFAEFLKKEQLINQDLVGERQYLQQVASADKKQAEQQLQILRQQLKSVKKDNEDLLKFEQQQHQINIKSLQNEIEAKTALVADLQKNIQVQKCEYQKECQEKQVSINNLTENNSKLTEQIAQISSKYNELKNHQNELSFTIEQLEKKNEHHQSTISKLSEEINLKATELQLSQKSNNDFLNNRRELEDKINSLSSSLKQTADQVTKIKADKEQLTIQYQKDMKSLKQNLEQLISSSKSNHTEWEQQLQAKKQEVDLLQAETEKKSIDLQQKLKRISQLQQHLAQQIDERERALSDQQLMQQVYKDFESREAQFLRKQEHFNQIQENVNLFLTVMQKDLNKQSIYFIKNTIDSLNISIKEKNEIIGKKSQEFSQEKLKLSQQIIEATNISQHFEAKFNEQLKLTSQLQNTLQQKASQMQKVLAEWKIKELLILNSLNKYEQTNQKLKIEVQQYKNKLAKKQSQISKYSEAISSLESKLSFHNSSNQQKSKQIDAKQAIINQLKKDVQIYKGKMLEENKVKIDEKQNYEKELYKMRTQIERINIETTQLIKKQITNKEESFKNQRQQIDQKNNQQLKKYRDQIENIKKEKEELIKQSLNLKNQVLQEKKNSARATAKMNQISSDINKFENIQNLNNELQQKLMLKDEQVKKYFSNMQSLKNTMSDLEEGIQTYQSIAEEAQKDAQEQRSRCNKLEEQNSSLQNEIERLEKKVKDNRHQNKIQKVESLKMPVVAENKKQLSILPLKMLFLKYFEQGSTYQAKLRTFNTLCQALSLTPKEMEVMSHYKRTKLNFESTDKSKRQKQQQSLQNKFFEFLTSE